MKTAWLFFIIALCLGVSCTYERAEEAVPKCNLPDSVSFSRDLQPLFTSQCATAGCHSGTHPEGNLDLEASNAYSELTDSRSGYVDTLNPEFSLLYAQMNSVSSPMPPSGRLDKCTLELVLKWIRQKAKNN